MVVGGAGSLKLPDGKPVVDSAELPLLVARTGVGKSVRLKVIRDKEVERAYLGE